MKAWQGGRGAGRPRGERPAIDQGTPETQVRRRLLAEGADPALSEYPLGLMLARRLVSTEQHEAGCHYAFLYGRTIGRTQVTCDRYYRQMIGSQGGGFDLTDEATQTRIEASFRLGKNRLLAAGRRVCDATENLTVFARTPRFLDAGPRRPAAARRADDFELRAVLDGLDVLVACYGRAAGRAGRMETHKAASLTTAGAHFFVDRDRKKSP